jgi:hypothetical protein
MPSFNFGFEFNTPLVPNRGAVAAIPIVNPITLIGLQIDCSIMSMTNTVGWSEVLFGFVHMPAAQWANWQFPNDPHAYINGGSDPNVVPAGFGGVALVGSAGDANYLCSMILKLWCPSATGRGLYMPLNLLVSEGDGLFCHMDQAGVVVDAEMQGVIFYA